MAPASKRLSRITQDFLKEEYLAELEHAFQQHQTHNSGVTFEQFKMIVRQVMGDILQDSQLEMIFVKVDSNSSGFLDWSGFLTYLYNELQMKEEVLYRESAFQEGHQIVKDINQDVIVCITIFPHVTPNASYVDYVSGKYVTVSRDGILTFWNQSWQIQKRKNLQSELQRGAKQLIWMIDMVCLPNVGMLGVSSADNMIHFYDAMSTSLDHLIQLSKLNSFVTAIDYWFDYHNPDEAVMVLGDAEGTIILLHFSDCMSSKLFGPLPGKKEVQNITFSDILHNMIRHVHITYFPSLHGEWVKQVRYLSNLKSFLSCSTCPEDSMIFHGLGIGMIKRSFKVKRGISCFDFNFNMNIIATGSIDRCLRIWNPYITTKCIVSLYGHNAPISHVVIVSETDQVYSISDDKFIKVWDLREQTCLQTIQTRTVHWGPHPMTACFHNPYKHVLVLATVRIVILERVWQSLGDDDTLFTTHRKPLSAALYCHLYHQVVCACQEGIISVWNLYDGRRTFQVPFAHHIYHDGIQMPVSITAMSLDQSGRRLLTAGCDGVLKMWNLSNGALLKRINVPGGKEILAILCCRERIFFAGCGHTVFMCNENLEDDSLKSWPVRHQDDIRCLAFMEPSMLITGSWEGKMLIWILETGYLHSSLSFNMALVRRHLALLTNINIKSASNQSVSSLKPLAIDKRASFMTVQRELGGQMLSLTNVSSSRRLSPLSLNPTTRSPTLSVVSRAPSSKISKISARKRQASRKKRGISGFLSNLLDEPVEPAPPIIAMVPLIRPLNRPYIANLLVSDFKGMIQVWSTHPHGGTLAVFSSVSMVDQYVQVMITDSKYKYMFTGDTKGYVRTWYVRNYHSGDDTTLTSSYTQDMTHFPFAQSKFQPVAKRTMQLLKQFSPSDLCQIINVEPPVLLSSFRAHLQPITQLVLVEERRLLLTCSTDSSVRMYNMYGRYISTFGDPRGWTLSIVLAPEQRLPVDVRRVASASTLQVVMGGLGPNWRKVKAIFIEKYTRSITLLKRKKSEIPEDKVSVRVAELRKEVELRLLMRAEDGFSHIGKYFHFRPHPQKKLHLPKVHQAFKDCNPVYAYLSYHNIQDLYISSMMPEMAFSATDNWSPLPMFGSGSESLSRDSAEPHHYKAVTLNNID